MTLDQAQGMFRTHKTYETACTYLVVASQRKADEATSFFNAVGEVASWLSAPEKPRRQEPLPGVGGMGLATPETVCSMPTGYGLDPRQRELWSVDEPETLRARNGLRSFLDIELNEDVLDVRFDGLGCDAKTSCDFLVGSALADQIEDVAFPDAKWP